METPRHAAATNPTGAQYEITDADARAVVTQVGAGLRLFEVRGHAYTETFAADEAPPLGCGQILLPWPNRTGGARWHFRGEEQRLEVTEPERGNAIHGLVRCLPWTVRSRGGGSIELGAEIERQPGWPVPLAAAIRYAVSAGGLAVTHTVRNVGDAAVPFGVGAHSYVRAGPVTNSDCDVRLAARQHLALDPQTMLPVGEPQPAEGRYDLHTEPRPFGQLVGEGALDDCFTDCSAGRDGRYHHSLTHSRGGVGIWTDPDFRWVQVFTPERFGGHPRDAIAIEPMTCPPDALNSGVDLIWLDPGEEWSASWGIQPVERG
jgi:aldose 1-epimerase